MTGDTPHISSEEFSNRRRRAAEKAGEIGLSGLLVCSRGGGTLDRYGDVMYLTNFYTSFPFIPDLADSWSARAHAFLVLGCDNEAILVTDVPDDGQISMPPDCVVTTDLMVDGVLEAMKRLGLDRGRLGKNWSGT